MRQLCSATSSVRPCEVVQCRGTSFSRYRKRLRMEEACRLIRETNDKFYLIGSKVGYPDAVSFARVFKEEMGCTPSEYRSMHASGEES